MNTEQFFVSVIIPVYNGEAFLAEAVESIQRQNHSPLEIIVVDDGSTDGTASVAANFGDEVRYAYQTNSGPPAARNRGLRMAHGNVISFLDADDLWVDNKLELQLPRLAENPSVSIILGRKQLVYQTEVVDGEPELGEFVAPQIAANLGCGVFRRSVFNEVGFFDETLYYCDDWDWFMRARELGVSMVVHQQVVLFSRRHEHNLTNRRELNNRYVVRMLRKSLERRRQSHEPATSLPKLSSFEERDR
jgi:glycosyltransferase involved in cell wall biosynthesis